MDPQLECIVNCPLSVVLFRVESNAKLLIYQNKITILFGY